MEVETTDLDGVLILSPKRYQDDRGFFSEVYNKQALKEVGIEDDFVQDNHSLSRPKGTVRGMHFQIPPHAIAKLVRVTSGAILDVAVDIRKGSPTYGEYVTVELSSDNWKQIYVPIGFAHGFCTLEPDTEVAYKVTDYWSPDIDRGLAWDDPDIGINWPVTADQAILSDKDRSQPKMADLPVFFDWSSE